MSVRGALIRDLRATARMLYRCFFRLQPRDSRLTWETTLCPAELMYEARRGERTRDHACACFPLCRARRAKARSPRPNSPRRVNQNKQEQEASTRQYAAAGNPTAEAAGAAAEVPAIQAAEASSRKFAAAADKPAAEKSITAAKKPAEAFRSSSRRTSSQQLKGQQQDGESVRPEGRQRQGRDRRQDSSGISPHGANTICDSRP